MTSKSILFLAGIAFSVSLHSQKPDSVKFDSLKIYTVLEDTAYSTNISKPYIDSAGVIIIGEKYFEVTIKKRMLSLIAGGDTVRVNLSARRTGIKKKIKMTVRQVIYAQSKEFGNCAYLFFDKGVLLVAPDSSSIMVSEMRIIFIKTKDHTVLGTIASCITDEGGLVFATHKEVGIITPGWTTIFAVKKWFGHKLEEPIVVYSAESEHVYAGDLNDASTSTLVIRISEKTAWFMP